MRIDCCTRSVLILRQPDLGTAIMVVMSRRRGDVSGRGPASGSLLWSAYRRAGGGAGRLAIPARIPEEAGADISLDPETDPLGAGYHIIQSKDRAGVGRA